jgi:hypothetical protein
MRFVEPRVEMHGRDNRQKKFTRIARRIAMLRRNRLAIMTLLIALGAPLSWADVGGKITGTVKDQTNSVIPGAIVTALNTATGLKQTTKTDEQGNYSFPVLPVGQYEIDVAAEEFKLNRTQNLAISNGEPYFNTALFSPNALGTQGDAPRRPFYGPGVNNWDIALHKVTKLTESKSLELRFETFNTFNHAQFYGNGSVDGNIDDPTFGKVVKAAPARISQAALKFLRSLIY